MINKLLAGIIVSVSVIELNCNKCCSSCKSDKTNDDDKKNHKPKPITPTIPKPEPNVFKSIKIQECIIIDTGKKFNCVDITTEATGNDKYLFENVIGDTTVYGDSARLFYVDLNKYLLVFTKDIKDKIKDNKTSSKVCEISEGVHCLYVYYLGDKTNYGVISEFTQDDDDKNIFTIVECRK